MQMSWFMTSTTLVPTALLIAFLIFIIAILILIPPSHLGRENINPLYKNHEKIAFLFEGQTLIDATANGRAFLYEIMLDGSDWTKLYSYITPRFEHFDTYFKNLPQTGSFTLTYRQSNFTDLNLYVSHDSGLTKIIFEKNPSFYHIKNYQEIIETMDDDFTILTDYIIKYTPTLIWTENYNHITWANESYIKTLRDCLETGPIITWPLERIFKNIEQRYYKLTLNNGSYNWYDITKISYNEMIIFFAHPIGDYIENFIHSGISESTDSKKIYQKSYFHSSPESLRNIALDQIDHGVVIFSASGQVIMANRAYYKIWHISETEYPPTNFSDMRHYWRISSLSLSLWHDLEKMLTEPQSIHTLSGTLPLLNGRFLDYRLSVLPKGEIMIIFIPLQNFNAIPAATSRQPMAEIA